MRLLVLGGTAFLGREIARVALLRGHEVVCAARGVSGAAPSAAQHVAVDRNRPDALRDLRDTPFDAVVDTAPMALRWVRAALRDLAPAAHWTFVSSLSVYSERFRAGGTAEDTGLLDPLWEEEPPPEPDQFPQRADARYGGIKAACEETVLDARDPAFVVRPGLLAGPGDVAGVFGYWPARMARGGDVAIPGEDPLAPFAAPAQLLDVRDLADWIVLAAEERLDGVYDAVAPACRLRAVLEEIAEAVAPADTRLVPVEPERLLAEGVSPWEGEPSLPLWPTLGMYGILTRDVTESLDAGLRPRSLADTARAALAWDPGFNRRRPDAPHAGVTPSVERRLLDRAGGAVPQHGHS